MKPLRVLIVEDSENDEILLLRHLARAGYEVQSERVETAAQMKDALAAAEWDLVISDYVMPGFNALDALRILNGSETDIPFIVISGTIGEDVAVEAMRRGVHDYLLKGNLTRLAPAVERELENAASRRAKRKYEEDLRRSEASLANAQRIAHIGNWDWDIKNNRLFWSEEIYRIFGLEKTEFSGTYEGFFNTIHPEDRQMVQAAVNASLAENAPYNYEHCIVLPNGEERIVCEIGEVIFDEAGEPVRFTGTVQDITERKRQEAELQLMKSVVDSIDEGILISDSRQPDNPTVYTNAAFEKLTGYTFEETENRNCRFLQGAETNRQTAKQIKEALEKQTAFHGEILNYHKNGEPFWNELSISPVFDRSGRLTNFVGIQRNISERKKVEERLRESEENYRSIVETANEGIMIIDSARHITFTNRQMAQMLGCEPDEIVGRVLFDFLFEEDCAAAETQFARRMKGESETGEFRLRRKNGEELFVLFSARPSRNQAGEIVGSLAMMSDITEHKNADRSLQNAEANYRSLIESSPAIVYLAEPLPPFAPIYVSPNVAKFGYQVEEWFEKPDMWISLIHDEDRERVLLATENAMRQGLETDLEYRVVARDGSIHWLHDKGCFVLDSEGNTVGWQGLLLDITETKNLEEQLRQSQKLESIGRLAGGIAHDFNNMLTAINGYSELTLRKLEEDSPLRRNVEEIKKAGERSALLTQQLLAFSRQQVLQPVVLDLNELITDTTKMLQRLIGEDIELNTALRPKIGRINFDPGQMTQVIMNLAVNARDAMPHGGRLNVETANVFFEPDEARHKFGVLPGAYVMLAVSDTGHGIDEKIRENIFEPFFTTKEIGRGTGLGLATVYGIVKQSRGFIEVDSKVGDGATFKVYLPRVTESPEAIEIKEESSPPPTGSETILLVEDETLVRNLSREILENCGYTVIEAGDGIEAMEICGNADCRFDMLMTDVVMPRMGGRELAEKLSAKIPKLKVLFTSGYTDDEIVRHGVIETSTNFIQKPFTFDALARKVRELLDA